jgi:hypothetical protein
MKEVGKRMRWKGRDVQLSKDNDEKMGTRKKGRKEITSTTRDPF